MLDLAMTPFETLKGTRVMVRINTDPTRPILRYEGEIVEVAPFQMPWSSFLVRPLREAPWIKAKWLGPENLELTGETS